MPVPYFACLRTMRRPDVPVLQPTHQSSAEGRHAAGLAGCCADCRRTSAKYAGPVLPCLRTMRRTHDHPSATTCARPPTGPPRVAPGCGVPAPPPAVLVAGVLA